MIVKIGFAIVLILGVAGSADAEQLPSLFNKGDRATISFGGQGLAPSVLPDAQREFLMGPLALEHGAAVATAAKAQAASGAVSASGGKISPRRAFLYSVLVPGLGEWMAGARKRALVFFGVETITLGLWSSWKGKGNDAEDDFRAFADTSWHPENYIAWRDSRNAHNSSITHALPCSSAVPFYVKTGRFNGVDENDQRFSCDESEIQQYYELVGKYNQYVAGWGDLVRVSDGNLATYADVDSVENFHSDKRLSYEDQRDESNRYLKRASTLTGLILINHVFSAIDAARVARARSQGVDAAALRRRTRVEMVMQPWQRGHVPMLMAYKPFD